MPNDDEHKLDVDFEVIEDPEQASFPRRPNVVSRRGHRVKITATIHDVPEPEKIVAIVLTARVLVFDRKTIGEAGHASRRSRIWGAGSRTFVLPDEGDKFPCTLDILVSRSLQDDHLGEGPDYQGLVNVTPSSASNVTTGDNFTDEGLFTFNFVSM